MSIKLPNDCDRAGDATPLLLLLTAVGRLEDHIASEEAADVGAASDDVVVGVGPPGIVSTTVGPLSVLVLLFNRLSIEALLLGTPPISIGVALQLHLLLIVGIGPDVTVGCVVVVALTIAVVVVVGVNCPPAGPLQLPFSKHPHRGGAIVSNSAPTVEAWMVGVGDTVEISTDSSTSPVAPVAPAPIVSPPLDVGQSSSGDVSSVGSILRMQIVMVVTELPPPSTLSSFTVPSPLTGGSCSLWSGSQLSTPTRC